MGAHFKVISDAMLWGDYILHTLRTKRPPFLEQRGSRGALSLHFLMEVCISIRRLTLLNAMTCFKQHMIKHDGGLQPWDMLSLQLWLPLLQKSYYMMGSGGIAPQHIVCAIYYCQRLARRVLDILKAMKKNMANPGYTDMMSTLKADLDSWNTAEVDMAAPTPLLAAEYMDGREYGE